MDPRIQILDSVYRELCVVLTEFEEKLYNSHTDEEKNFFADFKTILAIVESRSTYEEAVVNLTEEELTYYYGIMKEFVDLLTVRLLKLEEAVPVEATVTKAKGLMGAWLVKTDGTHTLHYIWPTESRRITWYHCNAHPLGIDIGAVTASVAGDPVYAVIGGTLIEVTRARKTNSKSSYVRIQGYDGREYRYLHMDIAEYIETKFTEGDNRVEAGTLLGRMSDKESPGQVHLHLEIREGGECLNPLDFFPNIAVKDCDNDNNNVAGPERALIYQAPEATQGTDPVKWDYQKDGRFQAKSGAMLNQLTQYVEHKGLTWQDAKYVSDPNRDIKSGTLKATDVVYFPSDVISAQSIEARLAELDYEVDSDEQEDISGFKERHFLTLK